jgi:nucleoid-associated protein YgaU
MAALPPASAPAAPPEQPAPFFDLVRVEPTGDSVIAGRGAPGATVEMLRDGQVHARAVADGSGLFAFVPPPLPPGSHQITLQAIAPDGSRQRSRDSVTVAISEGRNTPPLVALTSPDKPTVILSNPEPPGSRTAQGQSPGQPGAPAAGTPPRQQASLPTAPQPAARRPDVRIVSVEAEDGGRLYVSGEAAPGATVRLYLNETMIAPGGVGADGKVSFAIGRGVRPGDYRVRIDDVDPVSGSVKSRAEVAFNVPATIEVPLPPQIAAATNPPQIPLPPPAPRPAPEATRPADASSASGNPQVAVAPTDATRPSPVAPGTPAAPAISSPSAPTASVPAASSPPPTSQPAPQASLSPPAASPGSQGPTGSAASGAPPSAGAPSAPSASSQPGGTVTSPAPPSQAPAASPAEPPRRSQSAAVPEMRGLPPGTIVIPDLSTAMVSRGDNLWRISRRIYGQGVRYTVIYGANQPQIRNPNLIYPGQVFVLPPEQEPRVQQ